MSQHKAACELWDCSEVLSYTKEIIWFAIQSEHVCKYVYVSLVIITSVFQL